MPEQVGEGWEGEPVSDLRTRELRRQAAQSPGPEAAAVELAQRAREGASGLTVRCPELKTDPLRHAEGGGDMKDLRCSLCGGSGRVEWPWRGDTGRLALAGYCGDQGALLLDGVFNFDNSPFRSCRDCGNTEQSACCWDEETDSDYCGTCSLGLGGFNLQDDIWGQTDEQRQAEFKAWFSGLYHGVPAWRGHNSWPVEVVVRAVIAAARQAWRSLPTESGSPGYLTVEQEENALRSISIATSWARGGKLKGVDVNRLSPCWRVLWRMCSCFEETGPHGCSHSLVSVLFAAELAGRDKVREAVHAELTRWALS